MKDIFGHGMQFFSTQRISRSFRAKVNVRFERGPFLVKTVDSRAELEEVLRLRYSVFHRELLGKKIPFGFDVDRFDSNADHLVIVDKKSDQIVGTYRLLSSRITRSFYSETEFCLYEFLSQPGTKLELSRACIHRDFRSGAVIHLLWRGLVEYIHQIEARYLFGLASVKSMEAAEAARIYRHLDSIGRLARELHIHPVGEYRMPEFPEVIRSLEGTESPIPETEARTVIPPLFQAYLKAGAQVYGSPAIDRDFQCIDFLTVLDMRNLHPAYGRKYVSC